MNIKIKDVYDSVKPVPFQSGIESPILKPDQNECIVDILLKKIIEFDSQSCGRCIFCAEGLSQMKLILTDIANKKGRSGDVDLLLDLCLQLKYQVLCSLGVAAAEMVENAVADFREDIEGHIMRKICRTLVCNKFVTFHILPEKCTGCQECMDACEEDAISGKKNYIHVIDQEDCVQCGKCVNFCGEKAIVKAGPIKPKCPDKPLACGTWK